MEPGANQKVSHRRAVDEFLQRGLRVKVMAKFDLLEAGSLDGPPPSTSKHEKKKWTCQKCRTVMLSKFSLQRHTERGAKATQSEITSLNATYAKENTKQKSSSLHLLEVATIRTPFSFRKKWPLPHSNLVKLLPQQVSEMGLTLLTFVHPTRMGPFTIHLLTHQRF